MNYWYENPGISAAYKPFLDDVLNDCRAAVHSIHIVGSALTEDYDAKTSDINSVIVLHTTDLKFLEYLAPLGKKHGKKRVAAPLMMTPSDIEASLDVFPMEFLNLKLVHHTLFGDDIFRDLDIKKPDLRRQCERELKVRLIGLRQGYISASGNRKMLAKGFVDSFAGYMPLFKAIIALLASEVPQNNRESLTVLEELTGVDLEVFKLVLQLKKERTTPSIEQLKTIFEDYHAAIENLGEIIDGLEV
jgi:hypothetical protein